MKPGCYFVKDERTRNRGTLTFAVRAHPEFFDHDLNVTKLFLVGVRFWNLAGAHYHYTRVDLEHPDFLDDEENGIVVIGSDDGNIYLKWPDAEDFKMVEHEMEDDPAYYAAQTDEQRQAYLSKLMSIGQA